MIKFKWTEGQFGYHYLRIGALISASVHYDGINSKGYQAHLNRYTLRTYFLSIEEAKIGVEELIKSQNKQLEK